ncbi:MAG: OmpH family outer membrane protein [Bacteroidales bacterium]|jgi:outer membrane protein|nr:OmpH family outer membrane protein [Bacteroidales bacterium]MCK9448302.1 OmpH family outer membrane protein [Bacteroidales bacterium]MDD3701696.1 OmpH family outer membrane protein [Bacteroidales bacterium]MDY0369907.1 OmpH family outer membrane protein [Bacteroidales bacterium]
MKTLTRSLLFVTLFALTGAIQAQTIKIGHVDSNEIMNLMPERTEIENKLRTFEQQLEDELRTMMGEYQKKVMDYQDNMATMSNLIKQSKEKEITDLQNRIQDFNQNAEAEYGEKRVELLTPLIDKVKKAIEDVGKEKGYAYILDAATGVLLHIGTGANDLTADVKAKLNIK